MSAIDGPPAFVDTNVLVYAYVAEHEDKRQVARRLLHDLFVARAFRTSTQVLQELFYTITRKGASLATPAAALSYVDELAEWPVVVNDLSSIRDAAKLSEQHTISFWDALIVVAAVRSGAQRLYSEDLQHGRKLLGVEIVNPFLA